MITNIVVIVTHSNPFVNLLPPKIVLTENFKGVRIKIQAAA